MSKGNVWYQTLWYFIGWILISLFCNAINSLWLGIADFLPYAIRAILAMVVQGGIAMVIFYFIFLVIFPDVHKMSTKADKKALKKKACFESAKKNQVGNKILKAEAQYNAAKEAAVKAKKVSNIAKANKNIASIKSICGSKISQAIALQKAFAKAEKTNSPRLTELKSRKEIAEKNALAKIDERNKIIAEQEKIIAENK